MAVPLWYTPSRGRGQLVALLIACIMLELCVGIIIIYIGNLHYYQTASGDGQAELARSMG